ncbi:hypothetical protein GCM10025857_21320 [Alicyclobacillus contaminans]|nr:hypothetical protein GCM10025857_21320 [Alicyclobacillus contaminans]
MLLLVFWAKFAFVYHIPEYAEQGPLVHAEWYITVKPWWFGPPVFDLASYAPNADDQGLTHPYAYLLNQLGKYAAILEAPQPVWVQTQP